MKNFRDILKKKIEDGTIISAISYDENGGEIILSFSGNEKTENFEQFPVFDIYSWGHFFIESQMRSTDISAGLTPDMREACPMEAGRIFVSFSAASSRSPFIEL